MWKYLSRRRISAFFLPRFGEGVAPHSGVTDRAPVSEAPSPPRCARSPSPKWGRKTRRRGLWRELRLYSPHIMRRISPLFSAYLAENTLASAAARGDACTAGHPAIGADKPHLADVAPRPGDRQVHQIAPPAHPALDAPDGQLPTLLDAMPRRERRLDGSAFGLGSGAGNGIKREQRGRAVKPELGKIG